MVRINKIIVTLIVFLFLSHTIITSLDVVNAQNSGVIRIKADGTVTGTDKITHDGTVYTVTSDLYATIGQNETFIFIEKNNITLNGAGYTIQGSGLGSAIYMLRSQNVTIENFNIRGFTIGIDFGIVENWPSDSNYLNQQLAFNNTIRNNKIEIGINTNDAQNRDVGWCIYLNDANQTVILENIFACQNPQGGVYFGNSTKNISLIDNNFVGCSIYSLNSNQTDVVYGNTVNGKSLIYLDGKSNQVFEEAGLVYLFNCNNIVVKNVVPMYNYAVTIQLIDTINSDISNSSGYILLVNSSYNCIHDNLLNSITLDASPYNQIFANTITGFSTCIKLYGEANFNKIYGNLLLDTVHNIDAERVHKEGLNTAAIQIGDIQLGGAFDNNIHDNMIIDHDCGFEIFLSSNNTITTNIIKECTAGIQLGKSHFNSIIENNITSCRYAISMYDGPNNNTFYYNNFIDNQIQCFETHHPTLFSNIETYSVGNTWDNSKTGNYWDTYTGKDTNGDGIGDTPYQVFEYMIDNYPLMKPFETSNSNANIPIPTYDPSVRPSPNNNTALSKELTIIIIIVSCIIVGVICGLLVYFRRLIFR